MAKETGEQGWWDGPRNWKVWAQGFGSGWGGIMGFGALYWTPLITYYIIRGQSSAHGATAEEIRSGGAPLQTSCSATTLL